MTSSRDGFHFVTGDVFIPHTQSRVPTCVEPTAGEASAVWRARCMGRPRRKCVWGWKNRHISQNTPYLMPNAATPHERARAIT